MESRKTKIGKERPDKAQDGQSCPTELAKTGPWGELLAEHSFQVVLGQWPALDAGQHLDTSGLQNGVPALHAPDQVFQLQCMRLAVAVNHPSS